MEEYQAIHATKVSGEINPILVNFDSLPDSAFVPLDVLCGLYCCSPATIWRRVRQGQIVKPVRIGSRTTRWKVSDLRKALSEMSKAGVNHVSE